jgi:hypothetical protein
VDTFCTSIDFFERTFLLSVRTVPVQEQTCVEEEDESDPETSESERRTINTIDMFTIR